MTLTVTLTPHLSDRDFTLYLGDAIEVLRQLPDQHVHCIVCSPPYWALRDYGTATWEGGSAECLHRVGGQVQDSKAKGAITSGIRPGVDASECLDCGATRVDQQIGLEATPHKYVATLVEIFAEARRVLRNDGTLWLNLGDSYASNWGSGRKASWISSNSGDEEGRGWGVETALPPNMWRGTTIKPKDLVGIPWSVALALRDDGWYLRRDIIWSKPNPMPESCRDRCTTAHEYIFMFSKKSSYYYDADSIREPYHYDGRKVTTVTGRDGSVQHRNGERWPGLNANRSSYKPGSASNMNDGEHIKKSDEGLPLNPAGRNKRSVWEISTKSYPEAHFATFPEDLIEPMIKAGCPEGGTVLDPFMGSGTTALVSRKLGRKSIGIELSPEYCDLSAKRLAQLSLLA